MSKSRIEKIKCPNCGKENDFVVWKSVNTKLNPELKKDFLTRDIFKFECPECKESTYFYHDFLYHEMEGNLMVYLAHDEKEQKTTLAMFEQKDDKLIQQLLENITIRVVADANDLTEKIFAHDGHRDDRIIELMKVLLYVTLKNEKTDWAFDSLRYTYENNEEQFLIFNQGKPINAIAFATDLYESIKSKYGDKLDKESKDIRIFDTKWAMSFWDSVEK